MLQKEYENSGGEMEIEFIPLMKYQIKNLQNENKDTEGNDTADQDASILTKNLINPKYDFKQWQNPRDIKTANFKRAIVEAIFRYSMPELKSKEEISKKILAHLEKIK